MSKANRPTPNRIGVTRAPIKALPKNPENGKISSKKPTIQEVKTKPKPKEEEKKPVGKTVKPAGVVKPTGNPAKPKVPAQAKIEVSKPQNSKVPNVKITKQDSKQQPLRAKPIPGLAEKLKEPAKDRSTSKLNVMDTVHNVTVASPPPRRKNSLPEVAIARDRTKTRTLNPDEILILKNFSQEPKSLESFVVLKDSMDDTVHNSVTDFKRSKVDPENFFGTNVEREANLDDAFGEEEPKSESLKSPVAFEINFDENSKIKGGLEKPKLVQEQKSVNEPKGSRDVKEEKSEKVMKNPRVVQGQESVKVAKNQTAVQEKANVKERRNLQVGQYQEGVKEIKDPRVVQEHKNVKERKDPGMAREQESIKDTRNSRVMQEFVSVKETKKSKVVQKQASVKETINSRVAPAQESVKQRKHLQVAAAQESSKEMKNPRAVQEQESRKERNHLQIAPGQETLKETRNLQTSHEQDSVKETKNLQVKEPAGRKMQLSPVEDYDDDFESYESDFETGASSSSPEAESSEVVSEEEESSDEKISTESSEKEGETGDESEETQLPVTVIRKETEDRKLDSGNYDMNSRREKLLSQIQLQQQQQQPESLDTSTTNSEQLDSGISYTGGFPSQQTLSEISPRSEAISRKMSKRGRDLMEKIQLDEISFTLFDLKPVSYEYFMKIYGNINSEQIATQTNENRMNTNIQTEEISMRSMWTQHPPQYDLKFISENKFVNLKNFCGIFEEENDVNSKAENDAIDRSFAAINKFCKNSKRVDPVDINFERLNEFLRRSSFTVTAILNKRNRAQKMKNGNSAQVASGFYGLNTKCLSATIIVQVFSNPKLNFILTVHENLDDYPNKEFLNLIVVWDINQSEKPIKLLSTWSEVCWTEVSAESPDVIVSGLRDGSLAMWDLRESYAVSTKSENGLIHFAATQSTSSVLNEASGDCDLGSVVSVRSFRPNARFYSLREYTPIQYASLNDSGILTIWTLVEVCGYNGSRTEDTSMKIEYVSPYARVKLVQSEICDLREYLELKNIRTKSKFEKTRSYFESDLFSDDALRELQETEDEMKLGVQGLRFTAMDVGIDRIYIGTNRNFVISCSKWLKPQLFRKIVVDESKCLFCTSMKLLWNEEFLVVGLSNGSVIAINCNPQKPLLEQNKNKLSMNIRNSKEINSSAVDEFDIVGAKSCTIQNIIRNERISLENRQSSDAEANSLKSFTLEQNPSKQRIRILDQQVLLSGLVLRKDLVQSIDISRDGSKLFALMDGNIRIFDFTQNKEVINSNYEQTKAISLAKGKTDQQSLVVLTKDSDVQIHILK